MTAAKKYILHQYLLRFVPPKQIHFFLLLVPFWKGEEEKFLISSSFEKKKIFGHALSPAAVKKKGFFPGRKQKNSPSFSFSSDFVPEMPLQKVLMKLPRIGRKRERESGIFLTRRIGVYESFCCCCCRAHFFYF